MEIRGIIFDFGGVFSDGASFKPFIKKCSDLYNKDYEEFRQVFNSNWHKASINEIPSKEFWNNTSSYLGIAPEKLRSECKSFYKFNYSTLDLAKKLKLHYKLGLLSNNIEDWLEEDLDQFLLRDLFDCVVASYSSGTKKPNEKIYLEMLDNLSMKPEECIFIDDLERNIKVARKLGIKSIHFKSTEQLYKELQLIGIKI